MAKGAVEKVTCAKCDAPVRENTVFCYNCGNRVTDDPAIETAEAAELNGSEGDVDARTKAALDEMVERFRVDEVEHDNKLAQAAAERKKARVSQRKPREFIWEPQDDSSSNLIVVLAVLITVVTAVVVILTVFWK